MKTAEEIWEEAKNECFSNNNQSSKVIALIAMENYAKQALEEVQDKVEQIDSFEPISDCVKIINSVIEELK